MDQISNEFLYIISVVLIGTKSFIANILVITTKLTFIIVGKFEINLKA